MNKQKIRKWIEFEILMNMKNENRLASFTKSQMTLTTWDEVNKCQKIVEYNLWAVGCGLSCGPNTKYK